MNLTVIECHALSTKEPSSLEGKKFRALVGADNLALGFDWHGGAYITIYLRPTPQTRKDFEVINVWNSYSDTPRIERTLAAFEAKVREWVLAYDKNDVLEATR